MRRRVASGRGVFAGALFAVVLIPAGAKPQSPAPIAQSEYPLFIAAPAAGLPLVRGEGGGIHHAVGVHVVWPARAGPAVAWRYEFRWPQGGGLYDVSSLDLVLPLVQADSGAIAMTAGWARWNRTSHATIGVRADLPMIPPAHPGSASVQLWLDVRLGFTGLQSVRRWDPVLWTQPALVLVLPMHRW